MTACRGHANPRWEFQEGAEWLRLPFRDMALDFTAGRRSSIEVRYCLGRRTDRKLAETPVNPVWVHVRDGSPCELGSAYQIQAPDGGMVDVCGDQRFIARVEEPREKQPQYSEAGP